MLTRTQEDKDFILNGLEETYYIENFINKEDIKELTDIFYKAENKVHKNTGPITSAIKDYNSPALSKIKDKIYALYPNSEIYHGMFFYVISFFQPI